MKAFLRMQLETLMPEPLTCSQLEDGDGGRSFTEKVSDKDFGATRGGAAKANAKPGPP
jgi:hypothetical protein